jgi:hypothetical protein
MHGCINLMVQVSTVTAIMPHQSQEKNVDRAAGGGGGGGRRLLGAKPQIYACAYMYCLESYSSIGLFEVCILQVRFSVTIAAIISCCFSYY